MNSPRMLASFVLFALMVPAVRSQEPKPPQAPAPPSAPAAEAPPATPAGPETSLKLQILITEFNGTQKLTSLPYTLYVVQGGRTQVGSASLRLDTKVPVYGPSHTAGDSTNTEFSYMDVGTDIDCRALPYSGPAGQYHLSFTIHRSSLVSSTGADIKQGDTIPTGRPLIRSFQDSFDVMLRDGQTIQGSSSVDPATGNVMKVDVTLDVQK